MYLLEGRGTRSPSLVVFLHVKARSEHRCQLRFYWDIARHGSPGLWQARWQYPQRNVKSRIPRSERSSARIQIHFFRKDDSLAEKVFYPAAKLSVAEKHTIAHVASFS